MFENKSWDIYFERLRDLNEEIMVEFALNLGEGGSRVCIIEIPVIEETIMEVSGFPQVEK